MVALSNMEWLGEPSEEQRRRLRQTVLLSVLCHLSLVPALVWAPAPPPLILPPAISVDLIAALPAPHKPPAAAPPPPVARPEPKVRILPKQAPAATRKPRVKPKPKPEPLVRRRPRPEELSYDDALAKLRNDLGEQAPPPPKPATAPAAQPATPSLTGAAAGQGVRLPPEVASWILSVRRHIRSVLITPPEFRDRGLAAELEMEVSADGRVIGTPEVIRSSGDPYYDDNAVRAILKAAPLPAPPRAGRWPIIFTPEERG